MCPPGGTLILYALSAAACLSKGEPVEAEGRLMVRNVNVASRILQQ